MSKDSLSALEERVEKLLNIVARLKEEQKGWEKEKADIESKVEGIMKRVEKVIGEEI